MRALIEVPGWEAVCFNAPVVETYRLPDATRHPGLGGLGPDLCRVDADLGRCVELLLAYDDPQASLAEVLLDQRVFCGVGNVYRCEVLWAGELSPFAHVVDLPESDAVRLVNVAAKLVRANLQHAERITVAGPCGRSASVAACGRRQAGRALPSLRRCPGCQVRPTRGRPGRRTPHWCDRHLPGPLLTTSHSRRAG